MTKTLLITGGGRGLGAATALAAARAGWDVAVNYREKSARAEQIVAEVKRVGRKAAAYAADVADDAAVAAMFATLDRDFGRLDGLVNSAGIIGPHGRIDAVDAAGLDRLFAINITGTLICCREAIRRMSTKHGGKGGAIVNLSSAASRIGGAGETVPYAASKGAIDSLTFGLAQEVVAEGIRVNAVSPGVIDTEIQPEGRAARVGPNLPMKRAGKAEEVATAILYLLSDEASYIAGTVLDVTGGR
ncbi:MAG TPA: SDR family oxidoreductase [Stellaceae bacterium]|jgi:NAD(P)-dependent dehydrogenase (short-subunit alcohol dehydrogenase family)